MSYIVPRNVADLERLVAEGAEEGVHLEFKSAKALAHKHPNLEKFKQDLPIDVSAFANAGGGCLLIGVDEEDGGRAKSIYGIQDNRYRAAWCENVLLSAIKPRIPGLAIHELLHETGLVIVVDVPLSCSGPHQARDGKFYCRRQMRNDVLEVFELELLKLRRDRNDDGVFAGLCIMGPILCAVVENNRNWPIYNVGFDVRGEVAEKFQYQRKLVNGRLGALGARSKIQSMLGSVYTMLQASDFDVPFEYEFVFRLEEGAAERSMRGRVAIGDLRDTMLLQSDVDRIEGAVKDGFESVGRKIEQGLGLLSVSVGSGFGPTGIDISVSTISRIASMLGHGGGESPRWRGEWMSVKGFQEVLGVDRQVALDLFDLFDAVRYCDHDLRRKLISVVGITPELEQKVRQSFIVPDWM